MTSPILILGSPRSGTTWLAKIIDSHPDVLYRHEPDATLPGPSPMTPDALPGVLGRWIADRTPRSVTKRPLFAKSWQSAWQRVLRTLLVNAASAAGRMPPPFRTLATLPIPDFARAPAKRVVIKSIEWAQGAAVLARTLPASRTIFILRHPCGQVCSIMRGHSQRRFELKTEGTDLPFDADATTSFAAQFGVDEATFKALPDAAKFAWSWRTFNEPTYAALAPLPNVQVVLYLDLCAQPVELARRIMTFAGLDWHRQTEDFVARSTTHQGKTGYYAVFRDARFSADAWRTIMPQADQDAVRSVVAASPLAHFWPDLPATTGRSQSDHNVTIRRESVTLPP